MAKNDRELGWIDLSFGDIIESRLSPSKYSISVLGGLFDSSRS